MRRGVDIIASLSPSLRAINPHLAATVATSRRASARAVGATAHRDGDTVTIVAKGLRLVNPTNARDGWTAEAKRAAAQRALIGGALAGIVPPPGPWRVEIVRTGRRLMDTDGLAASAKHVRDEIAAWLGCDDGPTAPVAWAVTQETGRGYGVRVAVRPVGAPAGAVEAPGRVTAQTDTSARPEGAVAGDGGAARGARR